LGDSLFDEIVAAGALGHRLRGNVTPQVGYLLVWEDALRIVDPRRLFHHVEDLPVGVAEFGMAMY
jgi:hypothetical protein